MTDAEDRLRADLEARAASIEPPRTSMAEVRIAARRHARARRGTAVLVATGSLAAVVALSAIVPRLLASPAPGRETTAVDLPAGREDGPDAEQPDRGLPTGPAPRVPYVVGTEYRTPEGAAVDLGLPRGAGVSRITPFDGGAVIADSLFFEGSNGLYLFDGGSTTELGPCASGAGASSTDRSAVAWATFACPETGQTAPLTVQVATRAGIAATYEVATDPASSTSAAVAGLSGSSVVLNLDDEVVVADPVGTVRTVRAGPGGAYAVDTSGGLLIVDRGGVHEVVDLATGEAVWSTEAALLSFSPDGERVLERAAGGTIVVRDSGTGEVLQEVTLPQDDGSSAVWEDDAHLLSLLRTRSATTVVRVALDEAGGLRLEQAGDSFPPGQDVVLPGGAIR